MASTVTAASGREHDPTYATQLIDACRSGDWSHFQDLMARFPAGGLQIAPGQKSPLWWICHHAPWSDDALRQKMAKRLLAAGSNPNERFLDEPPLLGAVASGMPGLVSSMLKHGADVEGANKHGEHALHELNGIDNEDVRHQVLRVLLKAGADVNATTTYGWTPLAQLAKVGDLEGVRLLLDAGAHANPAGVAPHYTPLNAAAGLGHLALVDLLLDAGADPARVDHDSLDSTFGALFYERLAARQEQQLRDVAETVRANREKSAPVERESGNGLERPKF